MTTSINIATVAFIAMSVSACANVDVRRVTSHDQPGIRYWRPALFLALQLSEKDKKQTCEVISFTLPDKTEEYAIVANAGAGFVKMNPVLHDGWRLDGLDMTADSQTDENITALASLLKAAAPTGFQSLSPTDAQPPGDLPCRGIFRVEYNRETGEFIGFKPVALPNWRT